MMADPTPPADQSPPADSAPTDSPRAQTHQRAPEQELELKLKKNPDDQDAKVDVGSDQSMDASDPVAVTAPGGNEPAPSSSFPEPNSRAAVPRTNSVPLKTQPTHDVG